MTDRTYLKLQLSETLQVVDTCLARIYAGELHMYRALAGQLRILLCDSNRGEDISLLPAVFPALEVSCMRTVQWSRSSAGCLVLQQPEGGTNHLGMMPFEITVYSNGLAVADLLLSNEALIPIANWSNQLVTAHPLSLTAKKIVREVADRGGGSHVDKKGSAELRYLYQKTPSGQTYAEMFILGLGRFVQALGERLFHYKGSRVPHELICGAHQIFNLMLVASEEIAGCSSKN